MSSKRSLPTGILIGVIAAFILGVSGLIVIGLAQRSHSELPELGSLPDFEFINQDGAPFGLAQMKGKISIVDFIFTNCPTICPPMSGNMQTLYNQFENVDKIQFVSITVDPERDSTPRLREYADAYGADPQRWLFLTGAKDTIAALATDGFHSGSKDDPILHSTLFAIVDRKGHICNYYHSDDPELIQKVIADVAVLARDRGI